MKFYDCLTAPSPRRVRRARITTASAACRRPFRAKLVSGSRFVPYGISRCRSCAALRLPAGQFGAIMGHARPVPPQGHRDGASALVTDPVSRLI